MLTGTAKVKSAKAICNEPPAIVPSGMKTPSSMRPTSDSHCNLLEEGRVAIIIPGHHLNGSLLPGTGAEHLGFDVNWAAGPPTKTRRKAVAVPLSVW